MAIIDNLGGMGASAKEQLQAIYNATVLNFNDPVLLWENPNKTSLVANTTLNIDSSKYRYLIFATFNSVYSVGNTQAHTIYDKELTIPTMPQAGESGRYLNITSITDSSITLGNVSESGKGPVLYYIYGFGERNNATS